MASGEGELGRVAQAEPSRLESCHATASSTRASGRTSTRSRQEDVQAHERAHLGRRDRTVHHDTPIPSRTRTRTLGLRLSALDSDWTCCTSILYELAKITLDQSQICIVLSVAERLETVRCGRWRKLDWQERRRGVYLGRLIALALRLRLAVLALLLAGVRRGGGGGATRRLLWRDKGLRTLFLLG